MIFTAVRLRTGLLVDTQADGPLVDMANTLIALRWHSNHDRTVTVAINVASGYPLHFPNHLAQHINHFLALHFLLCPLLLDHD